MSYAMTLRKAGADILGFKQLGSYQGTWGAVCLYKGQKVLVTGSYGSCSYCDAFEGEFGYEDEFVHNEKTGKYYRSWEMDENEITKEQYEAELAALDKRYAEFGERYLRNPEDEAGIRQKLEYYKSKSEDDWFDMEEMELYDWAITFF